MKRSVIFGPITQEEEKKKNCRGQLQAKEFIPRFRFLSGKSDDLAIHMRL